MKNKKQGRGFAKHTKSSAALISVIIHAILIVVAASYVAVTVITKDELQFEAKKVKRPRSPAEKAPGSRKDR